LTGTARQPLFAPILSQNIYLSMNVCPQIFAAANCCSGRKTRGRLV